MSHREPLKTFKYRKLTIPRIGRGWLRPTAVLALVLVGALVAANRARAEDFNAPEVFAKSCAPCHGVDGKGEGPAVKALPGLHPANLTMLSAHNGGQFPRQQVIDAIDGRDQIGAHGLGNRRMPLWGLYFKPEGMDETSPRSQAIVKQRVDAMADYIQSLQQK